MTTSITTREVVSALEAMAASAERSADIANHDAENATTDYTLRVHMRFENNFQQQAHALRDAAAYFESWES